MARGDITHVEIPADDLDRAKRFYAAVAGWEFGEMEGFPDYFLFRTGSEAGGGLGTRGGSVGATIRNYISVDRAEDAVAAAEQHGGRVIEGVIEVPGQGRYAVVLDSEGNEIGLWETTAG
jgi:predicted enzyme related to lactoylglutathione lyase